MPSPQLRRRACTGAAAILVTLVGWIVVAPGAHAGTRFAGFAGDAGEAPAVDQVASSTDALGPIGVAPTRIAAAERTSGGLRLTAASRQAGYVPAWWAACVGRRAPPVLSA